MKNFLTQWETEDKNQKIVDNVLLINKVLAKLENDIEYASLSKVYKIGKKTF